VEIARIHGFSGARKTLLQAILGSPLSITGGLSGNWDVEKYGPRRSKGSVVDSRASDQRKKGKSSEIQMRHSCRNIPVEPRASLLGSTDYSATRTSSLNRKPKAAANSLATSIPTLTLPNSIELMYVRWTLARSAKSS
jgi:hypothetical protein